MAERRRLAPSGEPTPSPPISVEPVARFLPESYHSDSGEDSEDEPLSRRMTTQSGFHPSTFTVATTSVESDEEEDGSGEDSSGSDESDCEEACEVDSGSDSGDGDEDDLIYMGREFSVSSFRSQELLSRWALPLAVGVEM